ncbi:MAG TPA: hypothetical protein VK563_22415 [Puia sp.]|nr:hypothetical protein [Puia sp.]
MKKLIAAVVSLTSSILLVILISVYTASAQMLIFRPEVSAGKNGATEKIWINEISTRAVRNFKNEFRNVDDEDWRIEKDGFVAYFKADQSAFWVYYDLRGNWVHTLISYPEDKLLRSIRAQVKSVYYDYVIDVVKEIRSPGDITYIVQLEDKKEYKSVLINKDGEMELITSLDKQ